MSTTRTQTNPARWVDNERAAAVQAAVWFFSDSYVLSTSESIESTVASIVDHVISEGPLTQPPPPSLTISPDHLSGPAGSVLGPYTVHSTATTTVASTGADMYSDAAATNLSRRGRWCLRPADMAEVDRPVCSGPAGHGGGHGPLRQRLPV